MLKRIHSEQLRIGMFIEAIDGPWLNAPFVGRRFIVENESTVETLNEANLSAIFINTAKGLDVISDVVNPKKTTSILAWRRQNRIAHSTSRHKLFVARTIAETKTVLKSVFENAQASGTVSIQTVSNVIVQITKALEHNPDLIIDMTRLKSKDDVTFVHSIAVAALMIRFAAYLRFDKDTTHLLGICGLLHDMGKINVPTEILTKAGVLDKDEMSEIKRHPSIGYDLLSRQEDIPAEVLDVCLNHHERIDCMGYPRGLVGEEISMHSRMAAICDVYDAVTSVRPYKQPWSSSEASNWMLETSGYFDRKLLMQFLNGVLNT